jgi:ankyrin repeat protein
MDAAARKKRRAMHGIAGQLSASGYLPPLPLPTPELGFDEEIRFGSLACVKKALRRRGLSLNSIGLKGHDRLTHLGKRLKIALAREKEALDEAALCKELKDRGKSIVTVGVLGRERTKLLAQRLHEYRSKELLRQQAQEKIEIWKNIAGASPVARKKTFQDYNKEKYLKLFSAAISINNYPEVQRLIEIGCDPNFETKANHTALRQAATFNRIELTKWLVANGAEVDFQGSTGVTALIIASALGYTEMINLLISLGAKVDFETDTRRTPLIAACKEGRESSVMVLLRERANVNKQNGDGMTPLMVAAVHQQMHVMRLLLQHEADVDIADNDGRDVLTVAKLAHAHKALDFLKKHIGKRPQEWKKRQRAKSRDLGNNEGKKKDANESVNKRLHVDKVAQNAVIGNDFDTVVRLIRRRMVSPNLETHAGETPLMRSSWYGRLKEMEIFLAMGAEVDYQNQRGRSALMSAAKNNQAAAIELLVSWGAYLQLEDADGWTALMLGAENGSTQAVETLIQHGAFVNHRNAFGKTAFVAAIGSGQGSTASILMPRDAAMSVLETTVAKLAHKGLIGMDDGGSNSADVQALIDKGIPTADPFGNGDSPGAATSPSILTKGMKKVRKTDIVEIAREVAEDVDEAIVERLQEEAIQRGSIEAARKRGRREAVTDIQYSPLKNVPKERAVKIDPKAFTFSMDICENVLDGMRERLSGVQKRLQKIVEDGGTVPEVHLDYFDDPAELKMAAFYISTGENFNAAKMLKESLKMQRERFGETHYEVAKSLNVWGGLYSALGKFDKAVVLHGRAKKILVHNHGHMHIDVASTFDMLVNALCGAHQYEEAIIVCERQSKVLRRKLDRHHPLCQQMSKLARMAEKKDSAYAKEVEKSKALEIKDLEKKRIAMLKEEEAKVLWGDRNKGKSLIDAFKDELPPEVKRLLTMESLQQLLAKDTLFVSFFKKYARYAFFKFELQFFLEVEKYRNTSTRDPEFGLMALSIFKRYVLTSFLPALGQELRQRIKRRIKDLYNAKDLVDKKSLLQQMRDPRQLFDEAQSQILGIIHHGAYQEFYKSKYGRRYLIHRLSQQKYSKQWTVFQSIVRGVQQRVKYEEMLDELDEKSEEPEVSEALEHSYRLVMGQWQVRHDAARKIQGMFVCFKSRKAVKAMLKKLIVQRYDPSSRAYYYLNTKTGESSWEQPKLLQAKPNRNQSGGGSHGNDWQEQWDAASDRMYWYNSRGETTWENPNKWTEARDGNNRPYWYNDNGETTWENPNS